MSSSPSRNTASRNVSPSGRELVRKIGIWISAIILAFVAAPVLLTLLFMGVFVAVLLLKLVAIALALGILCLLIAGAMGAFS